MAQATKKTKSGAVPFFRFRMLGEDYLITSDSGEFAFVSPEDFEKLLQNGLEPWHEQYADLESKGFIAGAYQANNAFAQKYLTANLHVKRGPVLHIVIPTLRCQLKCAYCHASAKDSKDMSYDMSADTAKNVVDAIFQSPEPAVTLEFQGGEPMLNWEIVSFIVDYVKQKEKLENKHVQMLMVSNLTMADEHKLKYLADNNVALCTSLDGPRKLHDANRGGYTKTVKNLRKAFEIYKIKCEQHMPSAIATITKHSLPYAREIVDEYLTHGFEGAFIRPLNPFGFASVKFKELCYSPQEYLDFYSKVLERVLEINRQGTVFYENTALIFLIKILTGMSPNFMDLRSPCGAGIGQLAYNYDGSVYTCDEGRMVAMMGDQAFQLGNINTDSYQDIVSSAKVKAMAVASCLEGLPSCCHCVYMPYCGVCPVYNYITEGDLFSKKFHNDRCRINEGILDIIFHKLRDSDNRLIFQKWLK